MSKSNDERPVRRRLVSAIASGVASLIRTLVCQTFRSTVGGAAAALSQFAVVWFLHDRYGIGNDLIQALVS